MSIHLGVARECGGAGALENWGRGEFRERYSL